MTAQLKSEVNEMSGLWRGAEDCGIRKERAEEMLHAVKSLMKNLNFTMEQAMDALYVPKSEQKRYVRLLND